MTPLTYETILEKEEFITAEEYLRRHERGEIDPMKTRIVPPDIDTGREGGFMVQLEVPRYRAAFDKWEPSHAF
jgi:hypothetical protein